jgi:F-type H+-transporting ATPase subunit delta
MSHRASALRYARALLEVATREADPEHVAQELERFIEIVTQHAALQRVLLNPAVPAPRKKAAVAQIAAAAGFSPVTSKLAALLAERDRLELLDELAAAYRQLLLDRSQIVRAEVVTSVPIPRERAEAIEKRLEAATGKRISMVTRVDERIIGGVVARVGSTIYDGSLATHLKRMRDRLRS